MFFEGIKNVFEPKLRFQKAIKNKNNLQRQHTDRSMNIQVQQPGAITKKEINLIPPTGKNKGIRIIRKTPSSNTQMNFDSSSGSEDEPPPSRLRDPFKPSKKETRHGNFNEQGMEDFVNPSKRITGEPVDNSFQGGNVQMPDDVSSASESSGDYSESVSSDNVSSIASEMEFDNSKLLRKQKKYELLSKLQQLQRRGVVLTKNYTIKSRFSDLQFEHDRVSEAMSKEAGLKFARKVLMAAVTGIEFANKKFDPVQAKLDGWSESVMENVEDYDNALIRLVDKYGKSVEVAPEIELFTALIGSGFMFHLSKTILQNPVGILNSLGEQNPDMLASVMKNVMSSIRPGQEGGRSVQAGKQSKDSKELTPPSMNINDIIQNMTGGGNNEDSSDDSDGSSYTDGSDSEDDIKLVSVPESKTTRRKVNQKRN